MGQSPDWPHFILYASDEICSFVPSSLLPKRFFKITQEIRLMSGSCHLDRASNVEIDVECQIFVMVTFLNCVRVLQFEAHSRYYKGALTQKRSYLVVCTMYFQI